LRDQVPGYAVALVKAGAALGGLAAGHVRPPLTDISEAHRAELVGILAAGRKVLADQQDRSEGNTASASVPVGAAI
jgi:5-dehydro-4-deoxyglucarate dehydratase